MKTPLPAIEIATHYESGMTLEDLSLRYGCSAGRIRRVVAAAGVKIRAPGTKPGTPVPTYARRLQGTDP